MTSFNRSLAVCVLVSISIARNEVLAADDGEPMQTDVFVSGTDGYHTYRIPSLIVTKAGTVLAICEGRKTGRGDHGDLDLVLKRSTDGGRTWGPIEFIYEEGGTAKITIGNPCPVVDRDTGTIWLPFCRDNDDVFMTSSTDDGRTWTRPQNITRDVKKPDWGWYATGPGVGIQLRHGAHAGRLVIPCDHRERTDDRWVKLSHAFFSDDHGKTWTLGGTVAPHTDECQVVETADGSLLMNMRNYWSRDGKRAEKGGRRAVATSTDGGSSWGTLGFDKTLIESVCQASFLRYTEASREDRNRVLFSNPASKTTRHRMTVRLSYDEGKTWPVDKLLYAGSAAYSCLVVLPDKRIGIIYERDNYKTLRFARFSVAWLTDGKDLLKR